MKITAITRFKHGELYALLKKLGWTQSELSRRSGMCPTTIGNIINLKSRPTEQQANAIQKSLAEAGEFFDVLSEWPEAFQGVKQNLIQTSDIPLERLIDHPEVLQIAAESDDDDMEYDLEDRMNEALETLPDIEHAVVKGHFWERKTFDQIGTAIGRTRVGTQLIMARALRKLRHPERVRLLFPDEALDQAVDIAKKHPSAVI